MTPAHPKPKAYSYVRFSTAEQLKGKSLERQTEAPLAWCNERGIELDTELTLKDLGVSAFRGKNADVGALKTFLQAVQTGTVPKGSYLLVENFDRISREAALDAQVVVQSIVFAGITIVTLMDGKEYSEKTLRADSMSLIYMILMFTRGHEESMTKSRRVADAWTRKRTELSGRGKVLTALAPGWIQLEKIDKDKPNQHREPKVIPARARAIQLMFRLYLEGHGTTAIAQELNKRKIPRPKKKNAFWDSGYVGLCLANRAVIGEFQPHREDHSSGKRKRIPVGPPVKNYWPMIVDRRTFERVQEKLRTQRPVRRPPGRQIRSLLAGLSRCAKCGAPMLWLAKRASPRFVCSRARVGAGCPYRGVPVSAVEQTLIRHAETLVAEIPEVDSTLSVQIAATESAIKASQDHLGDLALRLDDTPSKTLASRIQEEEAKCDRLEAELETLKTRAARSGARLVKENARKMRDALLWHAQDSSDLVGVNAALRECFDKITIDYEKQRLEMHWRHGPTSTLRYD